MGHISHLSLMQSRDHLAEVHNQLRKQNRLALSSESYDFEHHKLVIQKAREARDAFKGHLDEATVRLPDGRFLMLHQYGALKVFAAKNHIRKRDILPFVTMEDFRVVTADLSCLGLVTLRGLSHIESLKSLSVSNNRNLTSLAGIPVRALEKLDASGCGLAGNLSLLSGADNMRELLVFENSDLTSLHGVPTRNLEALEADQCGLRGDLSALASATKLRRLCVFGNLHLTSLHGTPTEELRELHASDCGLSGDHTFLGRATKLEKINMESNPGITLDEAQFPSRAEIQL
jgi:hypothetical protein